MVVTVLDQLSVLRRDDSVYVVFDFLLFISLCFEMVGIRKAEPAGSRGEAPAGGNPQQAAMRRQDQNTGRGAGL